MTGTSVRFDDKVVSIFMKPGDWERDAEWSQEDKDYVVMIYAMMKKAFFVAASRRQCLILAAALRDMARHYPQDGYFFCKWANEIDQIADEPGRVPYRSSELKSPASG